MATKFEMPSLKTCSWLTTERAAEITGATPSAIEAMVATGLFSTKPVLEGNKQYTLVDRSQILAYFQDLTPAA